MIRRSIPGLATALLASTPVFAEEPPPGLAGTWVGSGYTLSIEKQVGRALKGTTTVERKRTDHGVVQMDDRALVFVNKRGNISGILLPPTSLAFCPDPRPDMKVSGPCYRLARQPTD